MSYVQVSLIDMINDVGEEFCKDYLQNFSSEKNKDVQDFIRNQAIDFAKQNVSVTFLVLDTSKKGKEMFVGYFTLTNKSVFVNNISKRLKKRIKKFAKESKNPEGYQVPMPLIAQLGKNFSIEENPLNGDELLEMAIDKVRKAQNIIGGKTTYIECDSKPKLYDFYSRNKFVVFGSVKDDDGEDSTKLVQMLLYLE